jgi:hypothetical protein
MPMERFRCTILGDSTVTAVTFPFHFGEKDNDVDSCSSLMGELANRGLVGVRGDGSNGTGTIVPVATVVKDTLSRLARRRLRCGNNVSLIAGADGATDVALAVVDKGVFVGRELGGKVTENSQSTLVGVTTWSRGATSSWRSGRATVVVGGWAWGEEACVGADRI